MEERNPILACELAVKTWSNIRKEELKDCSSAQSVTQEAYAERAK
jgi:hypothetical protein